MGISEIEASILNDIAVNNEQFWLYIIPYTLKTEQVMFHNLETDTIDRIEKAIWRIENTICHKNITTEQIKILDELLRRINYVYINTNN